MGCEALCKALKVAGSSGLKNLNLSHLLCTPLNFPLPASAAAAAGSMGCEALCKALKVAGSSGLKELNLSHLLCTPLNFPLPASAAAAAAAGSMGCEALCKALKVAGSSGLKELNLSHLPLDDRAAAAVAALLSSSRVLERLLMTHNNITDAGAQLICNALQVCPVISWWCEVLSCPHLPRFTCKDGIISLNCTGPTESLEMQCEAEVCCPGHDRSVPTRVVCAAVWCACRTTARCSSLT
jgi:hypothetical protein